MAENFTVKRGEDGVFTIWFGETNVTSQVRRLVIEIYDTEPQVGGVQLVLNVPISLDLSLDDLTGPSTLPKADLILTSPPYGTLGGGWSLPSCQP